MDSGDAAALPIAIMALIISVVAAVFTGWEAVTAHLARTRKQPAAWVISFTEDDKWVLHNVGGSVATNIRIRAALPDPRDRGGAMRYRDARIDEPIPAGGEVVVRWETRPPDPRSRWVPREDDTTKWTPLPPGEDAPNARYLVDQKALVEWRDYRGQDQSAKVKLR